jgi:hypothetical protein
MLIFPLCYSRDSCVRFCLLGSLLTNLWILPSFCNLPVLNTIYSILPFRHSVHNHNLSFLCIQSVLHSLKKDRKTYFMLIVVAFVGVPLIASPLLRVPLPLLPFSRCKPSCCLLLLRLAYLLLLLWLSSVAFDRLPSGK